MGLFLCRPFERECGVSYLVEADHRCAVAFLSDTWASDDYLTFWVKQRHEESTMKRWKWWIMASECQRMLCLLTREPIWTTVFLEFERLEDYHWGFFFFAPLRGSFKVCFRMWLVFLIPIELVLDRNEI